MVAAGRSDFEIATEAPEEYMRLHRGVAALRAALNQPRMRKTEVRIYWGPTGTGKTKAVYDEFEPGEVYVKEPHTRWYSGYDGRRHKCILIDDFDPTPDGATDTRVTHLLRLCDIYPIELQTKGGHVAIGDAVIIFTSNWDPYEWFAPGPNIDAFFRRVTTIRHYAALGSWQPHQRSPLPPTPRQQLQGHQHHVGQGSATSERLVRPGNQPHVGTRYNVRFADETPPAAALTRTHRLTEADLPSATRRHTSEDDFYELMDEPPTELVSLATSVASTPSHS